MTHIYKILLSTALFGALAACQNSSVDQAAQDAVSQAPTAQAPVTAAAQPVADKAAVIELGQLSPAEAEAVEKLMWVKTANAEVDAKSALVHLQEGKVKLYTFSGRGKRYPGLKPEQAAQIESRIVAVNAPGLGDVLHGKTHKAMSREVRDYVKDYNMRVYTALMQP